MDSRTIIILAALAVVAFLLLRQPGASQATATGGATVTGGGTSSAIAATEGTPAYAAIVQNQGLSSVLAVPSATGPATEARSGRGHF